MGPLPSLSLPPAWDGSYPYLTTTVSDTGAGTTTFETAIRMVQPKVLSDVSANEFQVDLHTGRFLLRQTDFFIADALPLLLTRTYRAWDPRIAQFGVGTTHSYDVCPSGSRYTYVDLNLEDGRQIHFPRISEGTGYADAVFRYDETASELFGSQITWNGDGWTLGLRDGRHFLFPEAYRAKTCAEGALYEIQDSEGHRIKLKRDNQRNVVQLISPTGLILNFKYDEFHRITEAADDSKEIRKYSYDSSGHLFQVADATEPIYRFEYTSLLDSPGYDHYLMTSAFNRSGKVLLRNLYHDGMVSEQVLGNGEHISYQYVFKGGNVVETIVTTKNGSRKLFFEGGILIHEESSR